MDLSWVAEVQMLRSARVVNYYLDNDYRLVSTERTTRVVEFVSQSGVTERYVQEGFVFVVGRPKDVKPVDRPPRFDQGGAP